MLANFVGGSCLQNVILLSGVHVCKCDTLSGFMFAKYNTSVGVNGLFMLANCNILCFGSTFTLAKWDTSGVHAFKL